MSQVFNNLISNALKYSDEDGEISIDVTDHQEIIEIEIKDTGIGIGLTITKAIIEAHVGTITVDSKINDGTIFTIKLPKKDIL